MRPRHAVLASLVTVLGLSAVPAMAVAAPHHNHGVTIAATPNEIVSGDGVLIYGQLNTSNPVGKTVVLYHRINPSKVFTVIQRTKTTSTGYYEFTRAEGVVRTNRSWFVRVPGVPGHIHSRTVHEQVAAAVSLNAPTPASPATTFLTSQKVMFTGAVAPHHAGSQILLQEQGSATGNGWKTIKKGVLDNASSFAISYHFKVPGDHTVRAFFPKDPRNVAAASDPVTVIVQQKEKPDFTISTSAPIIPIGTKATISGVLSMPGTTTPDPYVMVTLFGHTDGQNYVAITSTITKADGSYSFVVLPQNSTEYQVGTSFAPNRTSAQVFEGVQDAVTLAASSPTSTVGQSVTFMGGVTPGKAGHAIDLERLGADGHYHVIATGTVNAASAYQFTWTFGTPGTKTFRVFVPGGPENVGGVSNTAQVTVSLPAVTSLPPAS